MSSISISSFTNLVLTKGADVLYHREADKNPCPCRTPEGFRSPEFHRAFPNYPECNLAGYITSPVELSIKGFVQPATGGGRQAAFIRQMFADVKIDDYIGIFPIIWAGVPLDFSDWSPAGDEYIEFLGMRFIVIGWSRVPDPFNTSAMHHWENSLRRINKTPLGSQGF